jgi:hypothetical protein
MTANCFPATNYLIKVGGIEGAHPPARVQLHISKHLVKGLISPLARKSLYSKVI